MEYFTVREASSMLGKSTKTLYCLASRDQKRGVTHRFTRIDGALYVNIDSFQDGMILTYDRVS